MVQSRVHEILVQRMHIRPVGRGGGGFNPLNPKLPFGYIILCTAQKRQSLRQQKGWGHPQGDMHMVAARLSCQSAMVGTVWANSCPGCMDRL